MKAIIMAGGFGTRLRPLTLRLPKPMVPMVNQPMMVHIVRLLRKHGFTDLTSLLYFHPESISSYFGDGAEFGVKMNYVQADADYGTAGSVRNAIEELQITERTLIISGDVLTDFDLSEAVRFHESRNASATIVLTHVENPLQYGIVMTEADGRIMRFLEKPSWGEVFTDTINTGIYILEPSVFADVPLKREHDFSKDLFPAMLSRKEALFGYVANGYWRDVGNLSEYHEAHMDCLAGKVNIEFAGTRVTGNDRPASFAGVSFRGNSIVGPGTTIGQGVKLTNSVLGPNCVIEPGAELDCCVLWHGVRIGARAFLAHDVLCEDVAVGDHAAIDENVIVGARSEIGERAHVLPNLKLWPEKTVDPGATLETSLIWENRWNRGLFTNSRISGSSNIELNPEFGAKLGAALGAYVGLGKRIILSRDSDPGSRVISRALTSGIMSAGAIVVDLQQTPIPLTRHILRDARYSAGIHVRKNPIDRGRSDMIFFDAGGFDFPSGKRKSLERLFHGEDFPRAAYDQVGTMEFPAHTDETYIEHFQASLDVARIRSAGFRMAIDYGYGIASTIFPNILGALGAEVVSINGYLDPSRLARGNDEFRRSTQHLANVVTSLKYDIGFIIDAGGERVGIVDENGSLYLDNDLLAVLTRLVLESHRLQGLQIGKLAVPISATSQVQAMAEAYDVEVVVTKNTHADMMRTATADDVAFVGGTLGGAIFPKYFFAVDGMYTVAKTLEMLAVAGQSLGAVSDGVPARAQYSERVFCPMSKLGQVMRSAMEHATGKKHELVDGIKFWPDSSEKWVLILPEPEQGYCAVIADAADSGEATRLGRYYSNLLEQWRDALA